MSSAAPNSAIVTAAGGHALIVQTAPLLLRVEAAAELLALSGRSFERMLAAGRIPPPIRMGRTRVWRLRDLQEFVDGGCRLAPP